jgi:hypothetical protein
MRISAKVYPNGKRPNERPANLEILSTSPRTRKKTCVVHAQGLRFHVPHAKRKLTAANPKNAAIERGGKTSELRKKPTLVSNPEIPV